VSPLSIGIVGAGPAGCFAAQALSKDFMDAEITILDRLPVPFGLLRYGVAADHQGTKAVQHQFERLFSRPNVEFVGGLDYGRDVDLDRLRLYSMSLFSRPAHPTIAGLAWKAKRSKA